LPIMNRKGIVEALRTRFGLPATSPKETARAQRAVNYALRHLRTEAPEALFYEELRFRLEPPYETGTIDIDGSDKLAFYLDLSALAATDPLPATDGTLRGRWLEIQRGGYFYYRRIQDIYETLKGSQIYYIIVDEAWDNYTDTDLSYRIFTAEYPIPGDVQSVKEVVLDPDTNNLPTLEPIGIGEMESWRRAVGPRAGGDPTRYARKNFFQLQSPHYTPTAEAEVVNLGGTNKWGYDNSPAQQVTYGAAGTFSYRVVHVWGRWPFENPTNEGILKPFYMSAPSEPTSQVTTTWNSGLIKVTSPNIDHIYGYFTDPLVASYAHLGYEKWIFRARHATEPAGGSGANVKVLENDGIYYLWRVMPGYETEAEDRGDYDPVERRVPMVESHGHFHVQFDRLASSTREVLLRILRRPQDLLHDTDVPHLPPDAWDALLELTASYLTGDRDGNPARKGVYYEAYLAELERLKRAYSFPGYAKCVMGDGLSVGMGRSRYFGDITIEP
jgi:hypothetical protein